MVAPIELYYLRSQGTERGPFTLNQVASMWLSGSITAGTLYRVTNVENWTPLSQLDDTLRFVASSRPVTQLGTHVTEVTAEASESCQPQIVEGDSAPAFDPEQAFEAVRQFRITWLLGHLTFWFLLGAFWIGGYALIGAMCSLPILSAQVRWKKEQVLRQQGVSDQAIREMSLRRSARFVGSVIAALIFLFLLSLFFG